MLVGYGMQSVFYIHHVSTYTSPVPSGKRFFSLGMGVKKATQVCAECLKTTLQLGFGLEAGYKLTHGGWNDI